MKNKLIYAGIIATLFAVAMFVYKDTMKLSEVILAFVGASSTIGWVWKWIGETQVEKTFKDYSGMSVQEFKKKK